VTEEQSTNSPVRFRIGEAAEIGDRGIICGAWSQSLVRRPGWCHQAATDFRGCRPSPLTEAAPSGGAKPGQHRLCLVIATTKVAENPIICRGRG
jgi:hypothetical protein